MAKVKVAFSKEYKFDKKVFQGESELNTPTMGTMVNAGELCPPTNQVGFSVAIVAVMLEVPFNLVKAMSPEDFMALKKDMKEILPN